MIRLLISGILVMTACVDAASGQSVYGTWRGIYTITEMFTGFDVPYGAPPYEPLNVELVLHPYDPDKGHYGTSTAWAGDDKIDWYPSIVVALSQDANNLALTFFTPDEGEPTGYSDMTAVLSGDTLNGAVNDRSPAGFMWIHTRGMISLTRAVPEPSAGLLLALATGFFPGMRKRE